MHQKYLPCTEASGLEGRSLVSYRDETEQRDTPRWIEALQDEQSLGLVADAGTPTVSDPGFRLIRECRKLGIPVVPVPGPSAAVTALSVSGLPTDSFLFVGFLPPKKAARQRFFTEHADDTWTLILYESVHRISKLLDDLVAVLGSERLICVARELTKKFETVHTGPASTVRDQVNRGSLKGEFVVLVARQGFDL